MVNRSIAVLCVEKMATAAAGYVYQTSLYQLDYLSDVFSIKYILKNHFNQTYRHQIYLYQSRLSDFFHRLCFSNYFCHIFRHLANQTLLHQTHPYQFISIKLEYLSPTSLHHPGFSMKFISNLSNLFFDTYHYNFQKSRKVTPHKTTHNGDRFF